MASSAQQRRDQRRRLMVSWMRSAGDAAPAVESPRSMAAYDPEAHPERQRGPATLLPTGLGGLTLAILAIATPLTAAIVVAASEHLFGRAIFVGGGRFARTLAAAGAVLDPRVATSLQVWLGQMCLVLAAAVALIVRLMRRHRRDDYKGRYRAWGWMAMLFLIASCAGVVPLGRLVGSAMTEATGIEFGPAGIGWWIAAVAVALTAVSLWAVLPLHERMATAIWLGTALLAWTASAAVAWLAPVDQRVAIAGLAAWPLGAALAAIAMLVAARSVIREVRGEGGSVAKPVKPAKPAAEKRRPEVPGEDEEAEGATFEEASASAEDEGTVYVDGSEQEQRHLSKAERKRLRKLARMNGSAA
jgi:hypothetical protein